MIEQNYSLTQNDREFDLILFGASGATGQFAVEELARTARTDRIKWAIMGRNAQKLSQVLLVATEETGIDLKALMAKISIGQGVVILSNDFKSSKSNTNYE